MSSCSSNAGMQMSVPLIIAVVNNAVRYTPSHASIKFCLKSSTFCAFSARLAALYFEIKVLRSGLFSGQKSGSFIQVFYIIALLDGSSE